MRHNQNRRARGRNRKGPNPLTRSYESNGPDVKVRGSAAHIAEKYQTFARDALSAGDPIAAEAYFQHAEHYSRIIAAAQAQQAESQARREETVQRENGFDRGADRDAENAERDAAAAAPRGPVDQAASDQPDIAEHAVDANGAATEEDARPKRRRARRKPEDGNDEDKSARGKGGDESDGEAALAAFPDS